MNRKSISQQLKKKKTFQGQKNCLLQWGGRMVSGPDCDNRNYLQGNEGKQKRGRISLHGPVAHNH